MVLHGFCCSDDIMGSAACSHCVLCLHTGSSSFCDEPFHAAVS